MTHMQNYRDAHDNDIIPDDSAAADERLRRVLAAYEQPAPLELPEHMSGRVLASLPDMPPAAAAAAGQRRKRMLRALQGMLLALAGALCLLGGWGIFIDSEGPAHLVGEPARGLGYLLVILVLIAKPLLHMLLSDSALPLLASLLAVPLLGMLWWWLFQQVPVSRLQGARL
jgi:hypothetical protein